MASALPISRGWLRPQLARACATNSEPHGQCWGPGLLGQEQSLIPESLVTADGEKKCPSKVPSLMVSVSPALDFKGLENEGTTLWLSLGFVSCIPDQVAALH